MELNLIWIVVIGVVAFAVSVFNRLIRARNQCSNAWASVDVNLKKRHDLVPNLVDVVKAYAAHEREALEIVTEMRRRAREDRARPDGIQSEAELGSAIASLVMRVEAYPELKADQQFLRLQATLTEIEEQISAARRAYNASVLELNNLVEQFPTYLIASASGFRTEPFFSADPVVRQAPRVTN